MSSNKRADAESAIVSAIKEWNASHSFGASFRDVAADTGLPLGTVHQICRDLRDAGRITFEDQIARSLKTNASL